LGSRYGLVVASKKLVHELVEIIVENALAYLVDRADDEALVVDTSKDFAGNLVNLEKMMKVGGSVMLAEFAIASRI
jgi:hypothetical protein